MDYHPLFSYAHTMYVCDFQSSWHQTSCRLSLTRAVSLIICHHILHSSSEQLLKTDMRESKILNAICVYVKRYVVSTEKMADINIMKLISGTNLSSRWLLSGSRDRNLIHHIEFIFRINVADIKRLFYWHLILLRLHWLFFVACLIAKKLWGV